MSGRQMAITVAVKQCHVCGYELLMRDKFCRMCGSSQRASGDCINSLNVLAEQIEPSTTISGSLIHAVFG